MEIVLLTVALGVGATLFLDLWSMVQQRVLGIAAPDYALVGRWISYFPRGRFTHPSIAKAAPMSGERALGWLAHYAVGVSFAAILLVIAGPQWLAAPTLIPALLVGVASVVAPYLLMQPAMGLGFAASKAPKPWTARARSFAAHAMFGLGLYVAALVIAQVPR